MTTLPRANSKLHNIVCLRRFVTSKPNNYGYIGNRDDGEGDTRNEMKPKRGKKNDGHTRASPEQLSTRVRQKRGVFLFHSFAPFVDRRAAINIRGEITTKESIMCP